MKKSAIHQAFVDIAPRYQVTNHLLSGGLDFYWRWRTVGRIAEKKPGKILDLATGSGDLALALQKKLPEADITAADFCEPMLEVARAKGLKKTVLADAFALPFPDDFFDAVMVGFGLRNMPPWEKALEEIYRVTRKEGRVFVLDFSLPQGRFLRSVYRFYLHRILPRIAGIITGKRDAYEYLSESIEAFPSGKEMLGLLKQAQWKAPSAMPMTAGIVSLYQAEK